MSYEGYSQFICKNGHYSHQDEKYDSAPDPCTCGAEYIWENQVDETNCDAHGVIPMDVINSFILTNEVTEVCNLGHKHVTAEAIYKIPSPEQTEAMRHYLDGGKFIPLNRIAFKKFRV